MYDATITQRDFSDASAHYSSHAELQARIGKELVARATPFISKNGLLLDVGAGPGDVTRTWPMRTIAMDAAFGMCREALSKEISTVHGRAENLPFADESLDAVASNLMLQWLAAPEVFFQESWRVLKKNGVLAIATFTEGTLAELSNAFAQAGEKNRMSDFIPPAMLADKLYAAGFEVLSEYHDTITEHYADVLDLCAYLRDIGASNKRINRPRGMFTMRKLREVSGHYPKTEQGIAASWAVQIFVMGKK